METELLQAHLEAVQGGKEVSYLAATHMPDAENLAGEVFLPTCQYHLVALTQRIQHYPGIDAIRHTHRRHGIGGVSRVGEQV